MTFVPGIGFRRVRSASEFPVGQPIAIVADYRPVRLNDGRVVFLSGMEALQAGGMAADLQRIAQEIAYDFDRGIVR